jgi:mannosylglucosylglycerate synthase
MSRRILIIHYTPPSVIGGVERIIHEHIQLLKGRGFQVEVLAGREGSGDIGARLHVLPEIDVARAENVGIEAELARGIVSEQFLAQRDSIAGKLVALASTFDIVIAHNAFTLHFSLPLTEVLWEIAKTREQNTVVAWCHDLTWTNPLYVPAAHDGYPWSLLRTPAPNTQYVTVSNERRFELAGLWGGGADHIKVVPNGVDPQRFLRLTDKASEIVTRYDLFDHELVLMLPVRVTRRKNIELAMRAVGRLRDAGHDARFLVSGPVAPHHPGRSRDYLRELKDLRSELGLGQEVVFLADELGENLDDETVSCLYSIADALLFPSSQEGFGLPILEAGLARLPVVASDIPVFRELGGEDVVTFKLEDSPDTIAASVRRAVDNGPSRLYRRVLREYRWDAIMDRQIMPLLTHPAVSQVEEPAGSSEGEEQR